ncbi:MAG TPA: hypothetical protein VNW92_17420, partial [Polyangiaceae bacterium]|nr:hypothetical protein [Polyangiaceae bacterium]
MLRASGETIEGPHPSDALDVFVDDNGDLVVLLLDLQGVSDSTGSFLESIRHQTRAALETREPLHQVVNQLEMQLAVRPGVEAGLIILRLSQRDAKVEVLN